MPAVRSLLIVLLLLLTGVHGYSKPKFKHFYPKYESFFESAVQQCQPELQAYRLSIRTKMCEAPCACMVDCLFKNVTGSIQSNMASANVILGLTPAILVYVGPSVNEMAAISTWSPFLGFMLALASPAVNIQRVFFSNNLRNTMHEPVSVTFATWHGWLQRRGRLTMHMANIVKFVIVFGALINTIENSVRLDLRTVPSFRCGVVGLPLAWSLLGISIYIFAAVGVRMRVRKSIASTEPGTKHTWELLCAKHSAVSEMLLWIGSKVAVAVMIFGIAVLSSLLLISASDAVVVLLRYLLSAGVCQAILLGELASLRRAAAQQHVPMEIVDNEKDRRNSTVASI